MSANPAARASVAGAVALLLFSTGLTAGDWPQFLGPRANGISGETGLLDKWPTNGPPLVWEKKIGTGYSAPSVRGNLLVLHHRLGEEDGQAFFRLMREYTLMGFYTSRVGMQGLDVPALKQYYAASPACPHTDNRAHLGLKPKY